jgi:hypothetical protein
MIIAQLRRPPEDLSYLFAHKEAGLSPRPDGDLSRREPGDRRVWLRDGVVDRREPKGFQPPQAGSVGQHRTPIRNFVVEDDHLFAVHLPNDGVNDEQQLHEMFMYWRDQGLDREDIGLPAVCIQLHLQTVVAEPADGGAAQRHVQGRTDFCC